MPAACRADRGGTLRPALLLRILFRVLSSPAILYIISCLFSEECRTPGVAA